MDIESARRLGNCWTKQRKQENRAQQDGSHDEISRESKEIFKALLIVKARGGVRKNICCADCRGERRSPGTLQPSGPAEVEAEKRVIPPSPYNRRWQGDAQTL